jgi:hypothetical protein
VRALAAAAAVAAVAACTAPGATPVAIAWDQPLGAFSPRLLGENAVWSRGGLGLWDETAHALDPAVASLVTALHPGMVRVPGGTRAMIYHFDETIGPLAGRTPQCDPFTGAVDPTSYGLDEQLRAAETFGAEVSLVAPWYDGTPERTAALVAYVNGSPDSTIALGTDANGRAWGTAGDWAAKRVANGHPAPYGVPLLEIGNEQYLALPSGKDVCGTGHPFRQDERIENGTYIPSTAQDVEGQVAATAALVRQIDPAIRIGVPALIDDLGAPLDPEAAVAQADQPTGTPWNPTIAAADFDDFVIHLYTYGAGVDRVRLADQLRDAIDGLRAVAPDRKVAITEFGTFNDAATQLGALLAVDFVRVAAEEGADVLLRHVLIEDNPDEPFAESAAILGPDHALEPAYHAMAALAAALQPVVVTVRPPDDDVGVLATRDDQATTLGIAIVDRRADATAPRQLELALPPGSWHGTATTLAGASLLATGTTPATAKISGGRVTLPAHGIVVLRLTR